MSPQFGQLVQLFSDVEIQDLKVILLQKMPKIDTLDALGDEITSILNIL